MSLSRVLCVSFAVLLSTSVVLAEYGEDYPSYAHHQAIRTYPTSWAQMDEMQALGMRLLSEGTAPDAAVDYLVPPDAVDFDDINYFVAALGENETAWANYYASNHGGVQPTCPFSNCDANGSGHVDFDDINAFVALLGT